MRLLDVNTLRLSYFGGTPPPYAILSHTWEEEEVTFEHIHDLETASKLKGFAKIKGCCRQAVADGFSWAWIDTCCIDKSSSSELSEAINSMYKWYHGSSICYVYLSDAPEMSADDLYEVQSDVSLKSGPHQIPRSSMARYDKGPIVKSRWFKRGWTLQELIAPRIVEFYSKNWTGLGTKCSLESLISLRTRIPPEVLRGASPHTYCVSQRMLWAAGRTTTRKEDLAYCLLGLFGINMPLLYGEGSQAFVRLQEEILRQTEDMSLLAWAVNYPAGFTGVLASDPSYFDLDNKVEFHDHSPNPEYRFSDIQATWATQTNLPNDAPLITSRGILTTVLLSKTSDGTFLAWLHTAVSTQQVHKHDGIPRAILPPSESSVVFALCVELQEKETPLGSDKGAMSQLKVLERTEPDTIHAISAGRLKRFKPHKVYLSYGRRTNEKGLNWRSHTAKYTPIHIFDQSRSHSVTMVPAPGSSLKCMKEPDCIKLEWPFGSLGSCPVVGSGEPWNSARILGATQLEIACKAHQGLPVPQDGSHPGVISTWFIGWAFGDQVQHLQCVLRYTLTSEGSLLPVSRVEFADRKYGRLYCGHMLTIRIINRQSSGTIYTSVEFHIT